MNNLEWIEKEIKVYQDLKEERIMEIEDTDDEFALSMVQKHIDYINVSLQTLQQIKTIIEAWEVVFNYTMGDDSRYEINIYKNDRGYEKFDKAFEMYNKKY